MKIVYVIDSLASKGGAERILSDKMNYMAAHYGYEVYVVTCYQDIATMPNVYYLSDKVTQVNLNIPYYSQYKYGYPKRLWVKWGIYRKLRANLTATVQRIDPDVLIGLGYFNADLVTAIPCRAKKVVESHEARIFTMSDKGLSRSLPSRLFMRYYKKRYFHNVERHADVVVTLTSGDAKEWQGAKRVEVIPNFTVMAMPRTSNCQAKRVIAVGRLEWQKGYDMMIDIWATIEKRHPDWKLDIFGSGTLETQLKEQIRLLSLHNITINAFTPSIAEEYSKSSIFILTSRFEGFSLVLLEAMQAGLPCVSFDCPFGPSDAIDDGKNGFIVPESDVATFADKLCLLMEDDSLRQRFSAASLERAKLFDVHKVMLIWKKLFEGLQ